MMGWIVPALMWVIEEVEVRCLTLSQQVLFKNLLTALKSGVVRLRKQDRISLPLHRPPERRDLNEVGTTALDICSRQRKARIHWSFEVISINMGSSIVNSHMNWQFWIQPRQWMPTTNAERPMRNTAGILEQMKVENSPPLGKCSPLQVADRLLSSSNTNIHGCEAFFRHLPLDSISGQGY